MSKKKKKEKKKAKIYNLITLGFSFLAILISYFSYQTSREALEYQYNMDTAENIPVLNENIDSSLIKFNLNNNSELQSLQIQFPDEINKKPFSFNTKPIQLSKIRLDYLAKDYLRENLKTPDSTVTVGTFSIPVMMNYSSITLGSSQEFRENRYLVFLFSLSNEKLEVNFKNSFLVSRYGYPIKNQYFFKLPFTKISPERIEAQDMKDEKELLNNQFKEMVKSLKD